MNIAFFGSSLLSAYWNGAATYYRGMIRALSELGHRVTFYEPDAYERQQHRDLEPPSWARVVVYANELEAAARQVESARGADLVIKASGVGVFDEFLESALLSLQSPKTLVAFWDVDAPATLERVEHSLQDPFRELIGRYDLILTYGGGEPVIEHYRKLGARQCVPIYNALDPSTHFPVAPEARFGADLGFLGNRLPDREARVEEFLFRAAESLPGQSFLMGGSGWGDKQLPANLRQIGHVFTAEHNAFNCSVRAVLNVSRASMARYGFSPATRVFEAAGAASCVITDAWDGIEQFFEPGEELLVAKSGEEVAEHLGAMAPERLARIGRNAFARAYAEHTYEHRAGQFLRVLGAARTGPPLSVIGRLHPPPAAISSSLP